MQYQVSQSVCTRQDTGKHMILTFDIVTVKYAIFIIYIQYSSNLHFCIQFQFMSV